MSKRGQILTVVGIASFSMFVMIECHELLGHGLAAYLCGIRDFRLSAVAIDFPHQQDAVQLHRPSPAGWRWISAAGSMANVALAIISYTLFRRSTSVRPSTRYFFWLFSLLNLVYLPSYVVFCCIAGFGDWWDVIAKLPHLTAIRLLLVVGGLAAVLLLIRVGARGLAIFQEGVLKLTLLPYLTVLVVLCAAASLSPNSDRMLMVAYAAEYSLFFNVVLFFVIPGALSLRRNGIPRIAPIETNVPWIVLGLCSIALMLRIGIGIRWSM